MPWEVHKNSLTASGQPWINAIAVWTRDDPGSEKGAMVHMRLIKNEPTLKIPNC